MGNDRKGHWRWGFSGLYATVLVSAILLVVQVTMNLNTPGPGASPTTSKASPVVSPAATPSPPSPSSPEIVGFSGGCPAFRVYAQNRWRAYGARKLRAPDPLATKVGSFAANEIIAVDGWVHAAIAYPNNRPPWNSDVWYHVADGSGWVSFAGVRALPTDQDPTGRADGGVPAPVPSDCEGAIH